MPKRTPAGGHGSVTVIAPTAAEADALSTALFVLGPGRAESFCDRHPEVGAILVSATGDQEDLDIQVLGRAQGRVELTTTVNR